MAGAIVATAGVSGARGSGGVGAAGISTKWLAGIFAAGLAAGLAGGLVGSAAIAGARENAEAVRAATTRAQRKKEVGMAWPFRDERAARF